MHAVLQQIPGITDTSSSSEDDQEESQETANSLTANNIQLEILKLLRDIKADLRNEKEDKQPTRLRPVQHRKTPDNNTRPRNLVTKYFWTHGACDHEGKDCTRRAPGHRGEATKKNKLGGSKAYCS